MENQTHVEAQDAKAGPPHLADETETGQDGPGVISTLGRLPGNTILTLDALARMLGVCHMTVRRGVRRRELPPGVRVAGRQTWTVESITTHLRNRLERAARERERMERKAAAPGL